MRLHVESLFEQKVTFNLLVKRTLNPLTKSGLDRNSDRMGGAGCIAVNTNKIHRYSWIIKPAKKYRHRTERVIVIIDAVSI